MSFYTLVLYRVMPMCLKAEGIRAIPCWALGMLSKIRRIEATDQLALDFAIWQT